MKSPFLIDFSLKIDDILLSLLRLISNKREGVSKKLQLCGLIELMPVTGTAGLDYRPPVPASLLPDSTHFCSSCCLVLFLLTYIYYLLLCIIPTLYINYFIEICVFHKFC